MTDRPMPTVQDCMSPVRLRLRRGDDIIDAIDRLIDHALPAAAVVDDDGGLVGVLTEKDCLRAVASAAYENVQGGGRVGDYMSPVLLALSTDTDMLRAIEVFLAGNFPLLPVTDGGKLVGRVGRLDLLVAVRNLLDAEGVARSAEALQADSPDRPQGIEAMQRTAGRLGREVLAELFSRNR